MDNDTLQFFVQVVSLVAVFAATYVTTTRKAQQTVAKTIPTIQEAADAKLQQAKVDITAHYEQRFLKTWDELQGYKEKLQTATDEISDLKTEIRDHSARESQLKGQIELLTRQAGEREEHQRKDDIRREAERALMKTRIEQLETELDSVKREVFALGEANSALAKDRQALRAERETLINHAKDIEDKLAAKTREADAYKATADALREQVAELTRTIESMQIQLKALHYQIEKPVEPPQVTQ